MDSFARPTASPVEVEAVDAALGPPAESWHGGSRGVHDHHTSTAGGSLRARRSELLPALHAVNDAVGWISPGAVNYLSQRLGVAPAEVFGVASFYAMFSLHARPARQVHVCIDLACRAAGGLREDDLPLGAHPSPCLGVCERAPAAIVIQAGQPPRRAVVAPTDADEIAQLVNASDRWPGPEAEVIDAAPQARRADPSLLLLRRIGRADPTSLDAYRASGGYSALRSAIAMGPSAIIREVNDSKLVGRGGAAFPTGRKWEAVARHPSRPHYLVCNADESEPGTFKDRVVMEGDPFAIIESMTIAALATASEHGWIYVRGEYARGADHLDAALRAARTRGYLGTNILESGFSFDITLFRGAGAYICGEETAIFNSIEGYRGEPRNKPPFPVESGLFGKPTVVNNVETLVNIPEIVLRGGVAYARSGTEHSTGNKLFCVSGAVDHPGLYEVEFGATLRILIEMAGGLRKGSDLQAVLLGGAAGGFVGPDDLDVPLTIEGTRSTGTTLGSGVVMVLDRDVDLVDQVKRIAAFFRDESCGQCVPCRIGTVRQEEAIARLARGATSDDLTLLRDVGQVMRDASICGLGQTAFNAVESAIVRLGLFS